MTKSLLENPFTKVTTRVLSQNEGDSHQALTITHAHCTAVVSLYGGHVLSFTPTGHKDIFWLSEQASYQKGKAIRGGIPLCWPWFGPYKRPELQSMATPPLDAEEKSKVNITETEPLLSASVNHGFARQLPWTVTDVSADEQGVTLVLTLVGENQHPLWPNAYQLTQTLFFGKNFEQTLAMSNHSKEDTHYSAALHSYFSVSNPENITIPALTGVEYDDKVTGKSNVQQQSVSCVGEIDRVYHSSDKMSLIDSQWQRRIDIVSTHCQQWVLWNPGTELANSMADVHDHGEQEYVCLEAANTQWQTLPAGKTVTISQTIKVSQL
ncbi:D-hexose-6-phosphate mutarotase [Colwellia sp. E2M01]|uniref:D-hexose-6-phosphate mutarotase n=1 Tax=Colwellia sp. E2M01 TaxID=2841561 RepID=UPI001C08B305|nr:D-hexose-6-phosphate mutarotase [Colwellia sp. E2M01]MBU2871947.1 D-hexose-6-phosphate mutarotase [Colwellia sp. E2M01]